VKIATNGVLLMAAPAGAAAKIVAII